MLSRFVLFTLILVPLLVAANAYVHSRASRLLGLQRRGKILLALVLALGAVAFIVSRIDLLSPAFAEGAMLGGTVIALGVVISVVLLLVVDSGHGLSRIGAWLWTRLRPAPAEMSPPTAPETIPGATLGRREMIADTASAAALVVGGGSSFYGAIFGRHDYAIEEVPVRVPGLAPALDGYTIVQLSDIHFGAFVGESERRAAVELVRRASPDLVVLTGDLLDHDAAYAPLLGRLVRDLRPLARDGVVAIPGNHDYYAGIDAVLSTLASAGAQTLVNSGRVVGGAGGAFALLGVDDVWAPRIAGGRGPDLARAFRTVPPDLPRVLLCHNPVFFPDAARDVALQLSGHTHGGQVNVLVRPADLVLPYGYVAGRYERDGGVLYVNRGFGTAGPPARVGSPPEITKIVLCA